MKYLLFVLLLNLSASAQVLKPGGKFLGQLEQKDSTYILTLRNTQYIELFETFQLNFANKDSARTQLSTPGEYVIGGEAVSVTAKGGLLRIYTKDGSIYLSRKQINKLFGHE